MNAPLVSIERTEADTASNALDIPLVDGQFSADDSRAYILQVINELRRYHQRRNFSHQERFGAADPHSEMALTELASALESVMQLIKQADDRKMSLIIESSISVKLVPQLHV